MFNISKIIDKILLVSFNSNLIFHVNLTRYIRLILVINWTLNIVENLKGGARVDLKFTVSSGYVFDNATATNCQYSWKPSTGTLTISNPTSTVNVSVSSLQRLMKPTNLSISDGTLTFDEVANATNYAIYDNDTTILDTI